MMPKESAVSVGIVFMLVLGTLAVFVPEKTGGVIGTTLYVGGSGSGNYTTIQEALDSAEPGDTITVYDGTYYENLVITTAVTLKGTGTNTVIIDGNGLGDGVLVTSDHVTLQDMTIQGGGTNFAGIILQASNTTVTTCHIQDNLFGVYCLNQGNNTFQGCTLTANNEGFLLDTSPNNTITHCTIIDNKAGLWLDSTSNHNTITHCTFTGNEQGMLLWGLSNYNLISECTFTGNAIGIRLWDAKWNTFILNTFTNNDNHTESVISDNFWYSQEKINYSFNGDTRWGFVGNYWDDYQGSDDNGDGIGDIPYEIDANDDRYPLIMPYTLTLNQPPICILSASPASGLAPLTVTFTISASDPDGSISSWALDIDNDGNKEYSGLGHPPSRKQFNYTSYGSYTAKLMVIDNWGGTDSDTAIVTVSQTPPQNKAPTAVFIYSRDGHTVNFTDISTDPDGNVTSWYWDFGDQNFSNISNPTHEYKEEGDYVVNLTVTDDDNETDSFSQTIKVENREEDEGDDDNVGIPGFEGALSVAALISLVIMLHRYKEKKEKKKRE